MGRVIVGADGSKGGQAALEFAANEARMRGATLEVVYVHALPGASSPAAHGLAAEVASSDVYARMLTHDRERQEELDTRARQFGERLLADVVAAAGAHDLKVETTLLFDRRPARRLVDLLTDRDDVELLVVGSRGRGELTSKLLGSTSQACVTHARVPVAVVHAADT